MNIREEQTIIQKIAIKHGYKKEDVRDYFIEFCKDESCMYYKTGHLWVIIEGDNYYQDWSFDLLQEAIK